MDIETIREAKRQLMSAAVHPVNGKYAGITLPRLKDGIVWFGAFAAIHPGTFLDMFGVRRFRAMPRDISKARIERFIKTWRAKKLRKKN
jgi:hypothetical protein